MFGINVPLLRGDVFFDLLVQLDTSETNYSNFFLECFCSILIYLAFVTKEQKDYSFLRIKRIKHRCKLRNYLENMSTHTTSKRLPKIAINTSYNLNPYIHFTLIPSVSLFLYNMPVQVYSIYFTRVAKKRMKALRKWTCFQTMKVIR